MSHEVDIRHVTRNLELTLKPRTPTPQLMLLRSSRCVISGSGKQLFTKVRYNMIDCSCDVLGARF